MSALPMSSKVFVVLSALVGERAGLHFDASHAPIFGEKVGSRALEAGFNSLLDYYYFLKYDAAGAAEVDRLVEALVVNETYLFRELPPLDAAVSHFVVPLVATRRPRLWSAACATGEEPLTVAMLLAHHGVLGRVDLVASDISQAALTRARSGRFSKRAIRAEVPAFATAWVRTVDHQIVVDQRLVEAIDWHRVNLIDGAAMAELGMFDVIFCRNVLIYFNDHTLRGVMERLTERLNPGGILLVGISESLLRFGTALRCEEHKGHFWYRKQP